MMLELEHIEIVTQPIRRETLKKWLGRPFVDLVKAVVDVEREAMAIGGELHADEEALLLEQGSKQQDLWGINLYPDQMGDAFIEFDSMINIRPSQNNRSRGVEDPEVCRRIVTIVHELIADDRGFPLSRE